MYDLSIVGGGAFQHRHINGRAVSVHLQIGYPVAQKTRRIYRFR